MVIGHRGCPPATENTEAAIRLAAASGADAVEIDCRLSRQGEVVLEHDAVPVRTAWVPIPVGLLSTRWATRVPLRGGGRRPTLVEALALCQAGQIGAVLDLKEPTVASAVARILVRPPTPVVAVWSSHADALVTVERLAPHQRRALLDGFPPRQPDDQVAEAIGLGLEGVNLAPEHLTAERMHAVGAAGLDLWSGTDSPEGLLALTDLVRTGADLAGFTTDHPAPARAALT